LKTGTLKYLVDKKTAGSYGGLAVLGNTANKEYEDGQEDQCNNLQ
jgi:hypothetical protein